jgi:hypothetical protein
MFDKFKILWLKYYYCYVVPIIVVLSLLLNYLINGKDNEVFVLIGLYCIVYLVIPQFDNWIFWSLELKDLDKTLEDRMMFHFLNYNRSYMKKPYSKIQNKILEALNYMYTKYNNIDMTYDIVYKPTSDSYTISDKMTIIEAIIHTNGLSNHNKIKLIKMIAQIYEIDMDEYPIQHNINFYQYNYKYIVKQIRK